MSGQLETRELLRAVETERQTRVRRRAVNAVYLSGSILAFGGILYGTCWLYSALSDATEMRAAAADLLRELLDQVVGEERLPFRVAVTVRTTTFYTRTKSRKLPAPSLDFPELESVVADLLTRFDIDRPVRLLGVRLDLVTDEEGAAT